MYLTVIEQAIQQSLDYLFKDKSFISIFTIYIQILKKRARLWFVSHVFQMSHQTQNLK